MLKKPIPDSDLYEKLVSFQFSNPDDEISFEQRFAEESDFPESFIKDLIFGMHGNGIEKSFQIEAKI